MRLVSFVCLRAWTGPDEKGAGFWSTKGGGLGSPPPLEGGGVPPPPTAPQTVEHPSGSHIGWRRPPCLGHKKGGKVILSTFFTPTLAPIKKVGFKLGAYRGIQTENSFLATQKSKSPRLGCWMKSKRGRIYGRTPHIPSPVLGLFGPIRVPFPKGWTCWFNPLQNHYFVK